MKERLAYARSTISPRRAAELRAEVDSFHVEYCAALDANDIERWPEFFSKDATYRITSRQNALLDMPVGSVKTRLHRAKAHLRAALAEGMS